jgi:AraC-like DNA-binding protein
MEQQRVMQPTTIGSWAIVIWRALEARGDNPRPVFEHAGIDATRLHDANARFPISAMTRAWDGAIEATGDPCFGLRAGQYVHPTTFHALGYAWYASHTLHEALARFVRYTRMVSTGITLRLIEAAREVELTLTPATSAIRPSMAAGDAAMVALVMLCRAICGDAFHPLRVRMQRARPACAEEFETFFRAPIEYDAPDNAVVFDATALDQPLPTGNIELASASEQVIVDYLAHLDRTEIAMQVKAKLTEMLPSGRVGARQVAEALHVSVRSLQRKLADKGTSFAQLLEDTRRELARQYVSNSRLSVGEITYLLGFSDPANFTRAFRRWTGQSPSAFRQTH